MRGGNYAKVENVVFYPLLFAVCFPKFPRRQPT